MTRTAMSLFLDDSHWRPEGAFAEVVDFLLDQGVRGKVSVIPGLGLTDGQAPLTEGQSAGERGFLQALARAAAGGFSLQMELMTHANLWDFARGGPRPDGPHEGIWLYDPDVPAQTYRAYLAGVIGLARAAGLPIHGISVPGCGCAVCRDRWAELQARGVDQVSPGLIAAVLDLAREGAFAGPVVPIYADAADEDHPTAILARDGRYAVMDARLDMSVEDRIGFAGIDVDHYITADGRSGAIPDLVRRGAAQCFFCAHWFSMNPTEPEGWAAFCEIIRRINATLGDRIEWVRPGLVGERLLAREMARGSAVEVEPGGA